MGQRIEVGAPVLIGDAAVFPTDRGFTGMDGFGFDSAAAAAASDRLPARLALRIFTEDAAVARVYVAASEVVVTRNEGWDDAAARRVAATIEAFFLYYAEG